MHENSLIQILKTIRRKKSFKNHHRPVSNPRVEDEIKKKVSKRKYKSGKKDNFKKK